MGGTPVILCDGSSGGLPSQSGAQTAWKSNAYLVKGNLFGGGVYRYTVLRPDHHIYLSLVLRQAP